MGGIAALRQKDRAPAEIHAAGWLAPARRWSILGRGGDDPRGACPPSAQGL